VRRIADNRKESTMRNIPTEYSSCDTLRDAYADGWNSGHGIACHNVPSIGDKLWVESLGRVVVDAENIREVHESLCFEAESNGRSYSPFEHTAHRFNELGDGGWFVMPYGDDMRGPFDTQAEADAEAQFGFRFGLGLGPGPCALPPLPFLLRRNPGATLPPA
jgi:hypothetical protein